LATVLAGKRRVYSFATAGAPLSQYLIWARHAVREYGAQALAFFRDLPDYTGLPASRILFVVDGFRYSDAAAAHAGGYYDRMRRALLEKAVALG
jgi:hypothetical protein